MSHGVIIEQGSFHMRRKIYVFAHSCLQLVRRMRGMLFGAYVYDQLWTWFN